eukprot:5021354-Prymnesium_polylepis.1
MCVPHAHAGGCCVRKQAAARLLLRRERLEPRDGVLRLRALRLGGTLHCKLLPSLGHTAHLGLALGGDADEAIVALAHVGHPRRLEAQEADGFEDEHHNDREDECLVSAKE